MITQKNSRFALAVAAVLLLLVALLPWVASRAQEAPLTPQAEAVTDTVRFGSDLRAGEKPAELVGQYAWTSINGQVVESEYSTEPQPMETSGGACVSGGAGAGCQGGQNAANASTVDGTMRDISGSAALLGLVGTVYASASVTDTFSTGVRCFVDEAGLPQGIAQQPAGTIAYAGWALLGGRADRSINLGDLADGERFQDDFNVGLLLNLGGLLGQGLHVDVEVEPSWGWDEDNYRAYSEVAVHYQIRRGSRIQDQDSFTARSECGMMLSDGQGSTAAAGVGAQVPAGRMSRQQVPEEAAVLTSAPGTPQASGFSAEEFLDVDDQDFRYHLLSTRELDVTDRRVVGDVLNVMIEPDAGVEGTVGGARWQLFSAENAGEQVPVLEIRLADGTVVQARPELPGVRLPSPDRMSVTTPSSPEVTSVPSTPPSTPSAPARPTTDTAPTPPTTTTRSTGTTPATSSTTSAPATVAETTENAPESADD